MSWYGAHAILFYVPRPGLDEHIRVWENIFLIEGSSIEDARSKAAERARTEASDGWAFAGVRKLTECFSLESFDNIERPGPGSEITFVEYEATSLEEVQRFAEGRSATLEILDVDDAVRVDE